MRPTIRLATAALLTLLLGACAGAATDSSVSQAAGAPESVPSTGGAGYQVGRVDRVAPDGTITKSDAYAAADTKVIKTGSMTLEVEAIDEAVADARTAIVALGGYVAGTSAYDQGSEQWASITYRIPAERWDDAIVVLHRIGTKVVDEQTGAVEVTAQIVDLDARIRNLKATETQLLEIMTKATRITDILAVQTQLTEVRGQIEQLSAESKQLEDQAALGTITVSFTVPVAAVEQAQADWDLGKQIDGAIAALLGLGQFAASLAIWLVVVGLPALLGVGLALLLIRAVARRMGVALPRIHRRPTEG